MLRNEKQCLVHMEINNKSQISKVYKTFRAELLIFVLYFFIQSVEFHSNFYSFNSRTFILEWILTPTGD